MEKSKHKEKLENLIDAARELLANLSDAEQDRNDEGELYPDVKALREAIDAIENA